jgi:predicted Zn finger-like uncharacterized protein
MAIIHFLCPSCHAMFSVPSEKIPAEGGAGRCQGCGVRVVIFPTGKVLLFNEQANAAPPSAPRASRPPSPAPAYAPPPPAPPPQQDLADLPVWEVQYTTPDPEAKRGPFTLAELREMILESKVVETDHARVMGGDWAPARSYPALNDFFSQHLQMHKDAHGDEEHCAVHKERPPSWRCGKCGDYLCTDCVVNRPVIAGGADYFLCAQCEVEVRPVKRKGALKGLFGGGRRG